MAMRNNIDCNMDSCLRRSGARSGLGLRGLSAGWSQEHWGMSGKANSVGQQLSRSLHGTSILLMYGAQAALVDVVCRASAVFYQRLQLVSR